MFVFLATVAVRGGEPWTIAVANKFRREARHYRPGKDEPYLRPLNRNDRARILFLAESHERRTHKPRMHGGDLKRTGMDVLKALLNRFLNLGTGRCDPSANAIAKAANVARSAVFKALDRLEAAGFLTRFQRLKTKRKDGIWHTTQDTNAYRFNFPFVDRANEGDLDMPLFDQRRNGIKQAPPRVRQSDGNQHVIYKNAGGDGELSTETVF